MLHSAIVPSLMDSPADGTTISKISPVGSPADVFEDDLGSAGAEDSLLEAEEVFVFVLLSSADDADVPDSSI